MVRKRAEPSSPRAGQQLAPGQGTRRSLRIASQRSHIEACTHKPSEGFKPGGESSTAHEEPDAAAGQISGAGIRHSSVELQLKSAFGVAIKSGGLQASVVCPLLPQLNDREPPDAEATRGRPGLWSLLPDELMEDILKLCSPPQLGMLQATCSFFRKYHFIDELAHLRMAQVPRAKGMKPRLKGGERPLALLHFINSQSTAAAQATAIACGGYHSTALLVPTSASASISEPAVGRSCKHALHAFGRGFHGQLGNGDHTDQKLPIPASLGFRPCQDNPDMEEETMPAVVACGSNFSLAISRRGELFTWGLGSAGQLGLGSWRPLEITLPRQCHLGTRIVSIAAGAHHTLAIAENGGLWSCGQGKFGQLGLGHLLDATRLSKVGALATVRIVSAAAGSCHSMALAADGTLFTWGSGQYGQLGHHALQSMIQTVVTNVPMKLTKLDPARLTSEQRVTAIAAGANHSFALTVGGKLLGFGRNSTGALGTGDLLDKWAPTRADLGAPSARELPLATTTSPAHLAICLTSVRSGGHAAANSTHKDIISLSDTTRGKGTSALGCSGRSKDKGKEKGCRGASLGGSGAKERQAEGQAGKDAAVGSHPGMHKRVVQVVCGAMHTAALISVGGSLEVRTTGSNVWGQLGLGDRKQRDVFTLTPHIPSVVAIQSGEEHSMAVTSTGQLYVWGRGDCGQLGIGETTCKLRPTLLKGFTAVHPDRTLRRTKRSMPILRPVLPEAKRARAGDNWHVQ